MKLLPFLRRKKGAGVPAAPNAGTPYERLIARTIAAEDALLLIERTQEKGFRLEPCQFDVEKFDPQDECAGCPGLHVCTRRSARQEAAIQAMISAQTDACYTLLYDAGVALDPMESDTQMLFARLYVDIGLYTEGKEQREALENAVEIYQKLLTVTGDVKYHACARCCARILAGDNWEARALLRQYGAFE